MYLDGPGPLLLPGTAMRPLGATGDRSVLRQG